MEGEHEDEIDALDHVVGTYDDVEEVVNENIDETEKMNLMMTWK